MAPRVDPVFAITSAILDRDSGSKLFPFSFLAPTRLDTGIPLTLSRGSGFFKISLEAWDGTFSRRSEISLPAFSELILYFGLRRTILNEVNLIAVRDSFSALAPAAVDADVGVAVRPLSASTPATLDGGGGSALLPFWLLAPAR